MDRANSDDTQLWPCPRCRQPIASTSVYCPRCGLQLVPVPPSEYGARAPLIHAPDVSDDVRALPKMLRTWRLLLPLGLLLVGLVLAFVIYGIPADLQPWVALYLQLFFVPQGLILYLIGGALAPRASYLVGLILGVLSGLLYGVAIVATLPAGSDVPASDAALSVLSYAFTGAVLGFLAGGFAGLVRYLIVASSRHERGSGVG